MMGATVHLLRFLCAATVVLWLAGCSGEFSNGHPAEVSFQGTKACSTNKFLQKYHCSAPAIVSAAENGDPDAEYALGYMYFYGIGVRQDAALARVWISKAATLGQPLAIKALGLMGPYANPAAGDVSATRLRYSTPDADPTTLNTTAHVEPLSQHLPGYVAPSGATIDSPGDRSVLQVLQKAPPPPPAPPPPAWKSSSSPPAAPVTTPSLQGEDNSADAAPQSFVQPTMAPTSTETEATAEVDPRLSMDAPPVTPFVASAAPIYGEAPTNPGHRSAAGARAAQAKSPHIPKAVRVAHALTVRPTAGVRSMEAFLRTHGRYTVQLLTTRNYDRMQSLVEQSHLNDRATLTYYRSASAGSPWVLLYGVYHTRQEAHGAIRVLPPNLRALNPWVKSISAVRGDAVDTAVGKIA